MVSNIWELKNKLRYAIIQEDVVTIKTYLSEGGDVNTTIYYGNTLLHAAILNNSVEIEKLLIDAGADVNLKNDNGDSAFQLVLSDLKTCQEQDCKLRTDRIKMFVDAGGYVNTTNSYHATALHLAAEVWDANYVQFLIDRGADVDVKDVRNYTALHYAARCYYPTDDPSVFEILLPASADVNARGNSGKSPLYLFLVGSREVPPSSLLKIVELFKKYGADFYEDDEGWQSADHAILNSNLELMKALVIFNLADINHIGTDNMFDKQTFLHKACQMTDLSTIMFLLKNGAKIDVLSSSKKSPLQLAIDGVIGNSFRRRSLGDTVTKIKSVRYLLEWKPDEINGIADSIITIFTFDDVVQEISRQLLNVVVEFLAKLQSIGIPIDTRLLTTMSRKPRYKMYFDECIKELEEARNTKLNFLSKFTIYNLLVEDYEMLEKYAENLFLIDNWSESRIMLKFPIYGASINSRFSEAVLNRSVKTGAGINLSKMLCANNLLDPNHLVVQKILSFLKFHDLMVINEIM